jgi:GDPmannose 4,6-dehydratase
MKKAIIVGCDGQDGRLLYELLSKKGYNIIGVAKGSTRFDGGDKLPPVDISKTEEVFKLVKNFKPDEIYYLAAFHQSSEDAPLGEAELYHKSYETNVFSLINFLEGIRKHSPCTKLFYAASSHVFGDDAGDVQDEKTPINPNSIYGITKALGLFLCRFYRNNHSVYASTGILYNHESPLRDQKFVSKKIIRGALDIKRGSHEKLILGDLNAEIDWGWAPDFVEAMNKILSLHAPEDFVVATGKKHTVLDFVETTFKNLGLDWKLYVEENPLLIKRKTATLVGNPKKLMTMTGWKPSVDFDQMIKILLEGEASADGR